MGQGFDETEELVRRVRDGDRRALEDLFARHRSRLRTMVRVRLDPRLRGRLDPSDVLQEAYLEAVRRLDRYLRDPRMPFFLWLRWLTGQKILDLCRRNFGAQRRDQRREVSTGRGSSLTAISSSMAETIADKHTPPSEALARMELRALLEEALDKLPPIDREVLSLRHLEQLTNCEVAHELGITEGAASRRYMRALEKVKRVLEGVLGDRMEAWA